MVRPAEGAKKPGKPGPSGSDGAMSADDDREAFRHSGTDGSGSADFDRRRDALAAKLQSAKAAEAKDVAPTQSSNAGMAKALKLGSEFVGGIVVGVAIGLGFDYLVGTAPFGLIVFLLLGFAAGVLNVLRSVGKVAEPDYGRHKRRD
jgi:ATP synthase protein I